MIQAQFNVVFHINPYWSQVLVRAGNYYRLVLLKGFQELSLMGGQVLLACSPMEDALQSFQEVVDAVINLLWRDGWSPGGLRS